MLNAAGMFLIVLIAAAVDASLAPTSRQLAEAVSAFAGARVASTDVRRISCERFEEEPTEAFCKWQQKSGSRWLRYQAHIAEDGSGWHLIDRPVPIR